MIDIICCFNDVSQNSNWDKQNKFKTYEGIYLDFCTQFIILYNSIKKNWTFDYKIYLCHSLPLSLDSLEKLKNLDIEIVRIEPSDSANFPYLIRNDSWKLKTNGTHKLYLDTDMIALKNPNFDLSKDFLVMPCNSNIIYDTETSINFCKIINHPTKEWIFEKDILTKLWNGQLKIKDYVSQNYFPHFNGGAILMKNEISEQFGNLWWKIYNQLRNKVKDLRPLLFSDGLTITQLSKNWSLFDIGFNYFDHNVDDYCLKKEYFNLEKIYLYHYITDHDLKDRFPTYFEDVIKNT